MAVRLVRPPCRDEARDRRSDAMLERVLVCLLPEGTVDRRRAGSGQDADDSHCRARAGRHGSGASSSRPDLVPADLRRHAHLPCKPGRSTPSWAPSSATSARDEIKPRPRQVQSRCWRSCRSCRSRSAARRTRSSGRPRHGDAEPDRVRGTYPLPEAQVDRFMPRCWCDYPALEDEHTVAPARTRHPVDVQSVMSCRSCCGCRPPCRPPTSTPR